MVIQKLQLQLIQQKNVHGNSSTATKLKNSRKIKIEGNITGECDFDGSKDVTIQVNSSNVVVLEKEISASDSSFEYPKRI